MESHIWNATCQLPNGNESPYFYQIFWMQSFCDEYKIKDTLEQGVEVFSQFQNEHSGVVLCITYLASTGNFLSIHDYAAFSPGTIKTDSQMRTLMGAAFYLLQSKNPSFACCAASSGAIPGVLPTVLA